MKVKVKDTDLAWMAGIIDGEGSIYFVDKRKSKEITRGWISVGVNITNCDVSMIKRVSEIWYALGLRFWYTLHKANERNKKWNPTLGIATSGLQNTKKLLVPTYIYLVNKRPLARFMLEYINWRQEKGFWKTKPGGGFEKMIDPYEIEDWFQRFYKAREPKLISPTTTRRASRILGA